MGLVYKAYDRELDRVVALKVLHVSLSGDEHAVHLLRREITLASRITHPHVLRVYDLEEIHGALAFSMEYVDGETLAARLRSARQLPPAMALSFGIQCAAGLKAAHAVGVIHRDLKPQNILINKQGHLFVADFGLARDSASDDSMASLSGAPEGTLRYMSPEQRLGLPVDHRTDIYSFGLILREMITGDVRPADSETAPQPMERIISKCTAESPADRYCLTSELLEDLRRLDAGMHARGNPKPLPDKTPRNRLWIALALLALLAGATAVSMWPQAGSRWSAGLKAAMRSGGQSAKALYESGIAELQTGAEPENLERAMESFAAAIETTPGFLPAHKRAADTATILGQMTADPRWFAEASSLAVKALEYAPDDPSLWVALGRAKLAVGQTDEVIELLQDKKPECMTDEAWRTLGDAYLQSARSLEALSCFRNASERNPGFWMNHNSMGLAQLHLGRFDVAAQSFQLVVALNPKETVGYANLGLAYLYDGDFRDSVQSFEKALEIRESAENYFNLGRAFYLMGYVRSAVVFFEKVVELDSDSDLYWIHLADALRRAGQSDKSRQAYSEANHAAERSLQGNPDQPDVLGRLALCQALAGGMELARETMRSAVSRPDAKPQVRYYCAQLLLLQNDFSGAAREIQQALTAGYSRAVLHGDPDLAPLF